MSRFIGHNTKSSHRRVDHGSRGSLSSHEWLDDLERGFYEDPFVSFASRDRTSSAAHRQHARVSSLDASAFERDIEPDAYANGYAYPRNAHAAHTPNVFLSNSKSDPGYFPLWSGERTHEASSPENTPPRPFLAGTIHALETEHALGAPGLFAILHSHSHAQQQQQQRPETSRRSKLPSWGPHVAYEESDQSLSPGSTDDSSPTSYGKRTKPRRSRDFFRTRPRGLGRLWFHPASPSCDSCPPHSTSDLENSPPPAYSRHSSLSSFLRPLLASSSSRLFLSSEAYWIALYFICNLGLTLYNKFVLVRFPFPFVLTAVHALCAFLGCLGMVWRGVFVPSPLEWRQKIHFLLFSVLFTVNIAVSNISLQLVSIPFHQTVRASTPLFTLLIAYILYGTLPSSRATYLSLALVIAGVCLATLGEYDFTLSGLVLTLAGTVLAALKTVFTNSLQVRSLRVRPAARRNSERGLEGLAVQERTPLLSGEKDVPGWDAIDGGEKRLQSRRNDSERPSTTTAQKLHPLDLLYRMSPLALVQCLVFAYLSGEIQSVYRLSFGIEGAGNGMGMWELGVLVMNGMLAFGLNYVSFTANRKAGALSMTVAANVKQVLTILVAVLLFDISVSPLNLAGVALTLVGGACYAGVEHCRKVETGSVGMGRGGEKGDLPR